MTSTDAATAYLVTSARLPRRPGRPRPGGSIRLTRRGRLVLLAVLVGLVFAVASVGRVSLLAAGPDSGSAGPVATHWVVQPGETLWQVAVTVAPDEDPREVVARIIELNALPDASVYAGQTLLVPADQA